jgi:hypothetical protein
MLNPKLAAFFLAFFVAVFYSAAAEGAEFEIQVYVGDKNPGPKTDASAEHLKKSLQNLDFHNFTLQDTLKVTVPTGQTVSKELGKKNLSARFEMQKVKNEKVVFHFSIQDRKEDLLKQTVSMMLNGSQIWVCPFNDICVVIVVICRSL